MSAEARMKALIAETVRELTAPLERAVAELSARLAAVEGGGGAAEAEAPKRPVRGRTAKSKTAPETPSTQAKAPAAEVTAVTGEGVRTERVPEQGKGDGA